MKIVVRKPGEAEKKEALGWPVWEKEPSTFPWTYSDRETCLIMEGEATVSADREETSFGAGDYVIFPKGLSCVWTVRKAVRKHYRFG